MAVLQNTYYGPAPQVTTPGGTAVDSPTQGALDIVVAQSIEVRSTGRYSQTLVERFKGPHNELKQWGVTKWLVGTTRSAAIASVGGSRLQFRFDPPDPGKDKWGVSQSWVVTSVVVQQQAAGDHSVVTVTYESSSSANWGGATAKIDGDKTRWELRWEKVVLRPYAFCYNERLEGNKEIPAAKKQDPLAATYEEDRSLFAWRKNIEDFFASKDGNKANWEWKPSTGGPLRKLNYAEQHIAQKIINGESAVWHYPVITKTETAEAWVEPDVMPSKAMYPSWDGLGDQLDYYGELVDTCPYKGLPSRNGDWWFLKTRDDVTLDVNKATGKCTWTRTQQWDGAKALDDNFYGKTDFSHDDLGGCRWKVGMV